MPLNPRSDRPLYRQLADDLLQRIADGEYTPGHKLPPESAMIEMYGVDRSTVRRSLEILHRLGITVAERGRGTFIREQQPVRRISGDRYRRIQPGSGGTSPFGLDTTPDYRLDRTFREAPASDDVARHFEVDPGTPLLERNFVFWSDDQPIQMSTSYLLLAMVQDTPVADPANEPWPGGTIDQMATLGVRVTTVLESVRTRMPMPDEMAALWVPEGVPVFAVTRRMLAADRVVEAAVDIIIPGDRAVLDYRIDL